MSVQCSHPRCRFRLEDLCGIVERGDPIVLNVIGQCETMEPRHDLPPPVASPVCQQAGCASPAQTECAVCSKQLCQHHVHSYPNANALAKLDEQEVHRPGSVSDDDRAHAGTPLCHVCSIRFAPPISSEGYTPDG